MPAEDLQETPAPTAATFTLDDLNKARQQEKDKVYSTIEKLKEELAAVKTAEEQRQAALAAEAAEKAAALAKASEAELDLRSLLEKKETDWASRLEAERLEREKAFALLEREREYQELQKYRAQALAAEPEIIPELVDLVSGNTPDEINASIANLKERSARIIESARQATQNARREMPGTRVTAPPGMESDPEQLSNTPDALRAMNMADYAKHRTRLLGEAAANRGRGLFG